MYVQIPTTKRGDAAEIFWVFLRLGLTSFGGPIAHLGYFREEFVGRRGWLDDASFAQLLSICQFLPGPASSQMGFAIGLLRAGWGGAVAAFVAFTLPSALLMLGFALYAPRVLGDSTGATFVHGLKLVAVVVVAHGLLSMARTLTPDVRRMSMAACACVLVLFAGSAWWQLVAIFAGGAIGTWLCRTATLHDVAMFPVRYGRRFSGACFMLFLLGLAGSLAVPGSTPSLGALTAAAYRSGALVFGGGHVVLPLLEREFVASGWMSADAFLTGYGAAQAVPGPMFSLAAYLGASVHSGTSPMFGAAATLLCIFLPGFLLLIAALPAWAALAKHGWAARAMAGLNAAVVGLLAAALYDPVWREGVTSAVDVAVVAIGLVLLLILRLSALWVVGWCVLATLGWSLLAGASA